MRTNNSNVSAAAFQPKYNHVWETVIIFKNTSKIVSFLRCLWLQSNFGWKTAAQTKRELFYDTLGFFWYSSDTWTRYDKGGTKGSVLFLQLFDYKATFGSVFTWLKVTNKSYCDI